MVVVVFACGVIGEDDRLATTLSLLFVFPYHIIVIIVIVIIAAHESA